MPWFPQTTASWEGRLESLATLYDRVPAVGWRTHIELLPRAGGGFTHPTSEPKWRNWKEGWRQGAPLSEIWKIVEILVPRLVEWAQNNGNRWADLLQRIEGLARQQQNAVIDGIEVVSEEQIANREVLWKCLRRLLNKHGQFPDAPWVLPDAMLQRLEKVYERIAKSYDFDTGREDADAAYFRDRYN